jgi:DNA-binding transcriptional ArsR family regulator
VAKARASDAFAALSDPVRRDLLTAIGEGEVTVSELVERLAIPQPQVSKHLGVLKEAGLVHVRPQGKWRYYSVAGRALKQVLEWLERFSATWNERLDRLDDVVAELEEEGP